VDPTTVTCTLARCPDVTIRSTGTADLKIGEIRIEPGLQSDQFTITRGCENDTLHPNQDCTIGLEWEPKPGSGEATARLVINQNLPDPDPTSVTLLGNAENLSIADVGCQWTGRVPGELTVMVTIDRSGSDAVDVRVTHTVNGTPSGKPMRAELDPDGTATVRLTVPAPKAGGQGVVIDVDPDEKLAESDETDNRTARSVQPLPRVIGTSTTQQCAAA
jgi:CARDB